MLTYTDAVIPFIYRNPKASWDIFVTISLKTSQSFITLASVAISFTFLKLTSWIQSWIDDWRFLLMKKLIFVNTKWASERVGELYSKQESNVNTETYNTVIPSVCRGSKASWDIFIAVSLKTNQSFITLASVTISFTFLKLVFWIYWIAICIIMKEPWIDDWRLKLAKKAFH